MGSIQKIEANRNNAKLSTGPKTPEGKAASSRNALSTGIYAARESVLPNEDPRDLEKLTAEYFDRFAPASPEERCLVDSLVSDEWQLRRFRRIEGEMLTDSIREHKRIFEEDKSLGLAYAGRDKTLDRLQRRINAVRKSYLNTLETLREIQAEQPPAPPASCAVEATRTRESVSTPSGVVGFVPSTSSTGLSACRIDDRVDPVSCYPPRK